MNPIEELRALYPSYIVGAHYFCEYRFLLDSAIQLAEIYRKMAYSWGHEGVANIEEFNDREAMKMFKVEK